MKSSNHLKKNPNKYDVLRSWRNNIKTEIPIYITPHYHSCHSTYHSYPHYFNVDRSASTSYFNLTLRYLRNNQNKRFISGSNLSYYEWNLKFWLLVRFSISKMYYSKSSWTFSTCSIKRKIYLTRYIVLFLKKHI